MEPGVDNLRIEAIGEKVLLHLLQVISECIFDRCCTEGLVFHILAANFISMKDFDFLALCAIGRHLVVLIRIFFLPAQDMWGGLRLTIVIIESVWCSTEGIQVK